MLFLLNIEYNNSLKKRDWEVFICRKYHYVGYLIIFARNLNGAGLRGGAEELRPNVCKF